MVTIYATPILVCLSIPLSYYLYIKNDKILEKIKNKNEIYLSFFIKQVVLR